MDVKVRSKDDKLANLTSNNSISDSKHASQENKSPHSTGSAFIVVLVIFLVSVVSLLAIYQNFPEVEPKYKEYLKVPKNMNEAKSLGYILSLYKDKYFYSVLSGYFASYIFLQTFAIPGSIFLSILSGFLFPFPLALFLVCLCSALGASFCYLLSYLVGRLIVLKYFPDRVANWSNHVNKHRDNLLWYIVFLRITPFLPNWFINITSPVIKVPLLPFFFGTFFGVAPPSFVAIHAGTTIQHMTSSSDAISWQNVLLLSSFALLSLLPVLFKSRLQRKFD